MKKVWFFSVFTLLLLACLLLIGCQKETPPPDETDPPAPSATAEWEKCYTYEGNTTTGLTEYGESYIVRNGLTAVVPSSINGQQITTIGRNTFDAAGVRKLIVSEGITTIKDNACSDTMFLQEIVLPNTLTTIETYAFETDMLLTVTIPPNVTTIGEHAFTCCALIQVTNLSSVDVTNYLPQNPGLEVRTSLDTPFINTLTYHDDGHITYTVGDKVYWMGYQGKSPVIDLSGKGITAIYQCAQWVDMTGAVEIIIPESVTEIGEDALGAVSLIHLTNLSGLSVNVNAAETRTSPDTPFANTLTYHDDGHITYTVGETVYWAGYHGDATEIDLSGKGITDIYPMSLMFNHTVSKITLPEGLTQIAEYAFGVAVELKEINIPASVTSIEEEAFNNCFNLEKVTFAQTSGWVMTKDGAAADVTDPAANAARLGVTNSPAMRRS